MTRLLDAIDLAGRARQRSDLVHAKLTTLLDVGEGWVNRHVALLRSYVEGPANRLHDNVERRTQRISQTLDALTRR